MVGSRGARGLAAQPAFVCDLALLFSATSAPSVVQGVGFSISGDVGDLSRPAGDLGDDPPPAFIPAHPSEPKKLRSIMGEAQRVDRSALAKYQVLTTKYFSSIFKYLPRPAAWAASFNIILLPHENQYGKRTLYDFAFPRNRTPRSLLPARKLKDAPPKVIKRSRAITLWSGTAGRKTRISENRKS